MESQKIQVTVCGGGNIAHFAACVFGSQSNVICNVLTRKPEQWNKEIVGTPIENSTWAYKGQIVGKLNVVSNDAKDVCQGTKLFILCCPCFAYQSILKSIAPYIEKGAYIGSAYAQGCFNIATISIIGEQRVKEDNLKIFGIQMVPAIAFTKEYGKSVTIYYPKKAMRIATYPQQYEGETLSLVSKLFQIPALPIPNFLTLTLIPLNQIIHPARMYGVFENWDGRSLFRKESVPLLYEDFDQKSASTLEHLSDEIQNIKRKIQQLYPTIDLSHLHTIYDQYVQNYEDLNDTSNLQSLIQTNPTYKGLKIPLNEVNDQLAVNTEGRFFTDDVPFGLCIIKNIAQFIDIETPYVDKIIKWSQKHMNQSYILEGESVLNQDSIHLTGAPQRYNINSIEEMLQFDNLAPYAHS